MQYLPFARSRIKALRAYAADYATQRYVFPDATVTVQIIAGRDYITIIGYGGQLDMDSGVIDLKGVNYANATRQDTLSTQSYLVPYALGATGGRWKKWFSDPAQGRANQLIGTVEVPKFTGHLLGDNTRAPSFEAARQPATPQTNPPSFTYNPADDALKAKKNMANGCPASIFTGRTRLYVQAMYGRPLYNYGGDSSLQPSSSGTGRPSLVSTAPPALSLPAYIRSTDTVTYPAVTIDTSAGVRFDPVTGKHWLMVINGDNLDVYSLLAPKIVEKLRLSLFAGGGLSAADIEKLEAYILAYSLPDVANMFSVSAGSASPGYSMGYGWHWNWSGTAADIVTSTRFSQAGIYEAMESTQRRITVTVAADGTWSAARAVIEGPTRWAVNRLYWCVAEPDWGALAMLKSTPKNSTMFTCDAPFYAFYKRDALQVCRAKVTVVAGDPNTRNFSLNFCVSTYGGAVAELTAGLLDGFCEDIPASGSYFKAAFSCAGAVTADLILGKTTTGARYDVYQKAIFTPSVRFPADDQPVIAGGTSTIETGYDVPYTTGYTLVVSNGPGTVLHYTVPDISYYRELSTMTRDSSSTATIIVPFYDSEAIFVEGTNTTNETRSGRAVSYRFNNAFARAPLQFSGASANTGILYAYLVSGSAGNLITNTTPADSVVATATSLTKLSTMAGVLDATMNDLSSFHDGNDYAQVNYKAWAGAAVSTPAFAPGHIAAVGVVGAIPTFPALVGWV